MTYFIGFYVVLNVIAGLLGTLQAVTGQGENTTVLWVLFNVGCALWGSYLLGWIP